MVGRRRKERKRKNKEEKRIKDKAAYLGNERASLSSVGVSRTRGEGSGGYRFSRKTRYLLCWQRRNREGSKISSGDPQTDTVGHLVLPLFSPYRRRDFSKRRKKMEERKCVSRRETTRGGWRGEGEVVDPPEFYGPLPLPDYSFLIDARPPASFYELLLPRFFLLLLSQMDLCFPCRWSNPFPSLYTRWINTNNIIHK